MKKYISILIAVLVLAGCISVLPALAESFRVGDANQDGKVNIKDATHIQRYVASIIIFSDEELSFADVNGDGKVNIKDATMIQKFIANLIEGFPFDKSPEDATTDLTDAITESVYNTTGAYEPTTETSVKSENTDPEESKATDPVETKPTEPEESKATDPVETKPTDPEESKATDPVETKPTDPEESKATDPVETKPTDPEESKATDPVETKPTEPEATNPSLDDDGFNNQIVRP